MARCNLNCKGIRPLAAAAALLLGVARALACGPDFPNRLLPGGGAGLLVAPETMFTREIIALERAAPIGRAVITTNDPAAATVRADLAELEQALAASDLPLASALQLLRQYETQRRALQQFAEQRRAWERTQLPWVPTNAPSLTNPPPQLLPGQVQIPAGLPGEFADYFRGAMAWAGGDTNGAMAAWQALLKRPPAERHFRSIWAAFMLGKACRESQPDRAVAYFQETRTLAAAGFADGFGLAAASLGWEAQLAVRRGDFNRAIELYLNQAATGDASAFESLRYTASLALRQQATRLTPLAKNPLTQRVITTYLTSGGWRQPAVDVDGRLWEPVVRQLARQSFVAAPTGGWHHVESPVVLWLRAVEAANVRDVASAEKLALAAYQSGEWTVAQRWIDRAPESPTAQWLKAKLLLRDGKVEPAAALLAGLVRQFPPGESEAAVLPERLMVEHSSYRLIPASSQLLGEWGALHLARREYTEALDALLRSSYVEDALYVAGRVLTLDELKRYVDANWPEPSAGAAAAAAAAAHGFTEDDAATLGAEIRHVLATRLVRAGQLAAARAYFTPATRTNLDAYLAGLAVGHNLANSKTQRAAALWTAAQIAFTNEGDFFSAPVETDWSICSGLFTYADTPPARLQPAGQVILPTSADERERVAASAAYPDRSWYRRFIATRLAWEAAQLMPDNTDATARVLWQAGTWIKYAAPPAADVFYKALVRRCPQTALGAAADQRRWFPWLDEAGNIEPFKPRAGPPVAAAKAN